MGVHYANLIKSLSPLAYWRLGEATGATTAVDVIGGRNLTHSGATPGQTGLIDYDPNKSCSYSGSASSSIASAAAINPNDAMSVCFWYNCTSNASLVSPVGKFAYSPGRGWIIMSNGSNSAYVYVTTSAGQYLVNMFNDLYNGGRHFCCMSLDHGAISLTVDTTTTTGSYTHGGGFGEAGGNTNNLCIGRTPGISLSANGLVDEVALFDYVLSTQNRTDLYNAGRQKFIDLNRQMESNWRAA